MVGHHCITCAHVWESRDAEASSPCPWCELARISEENKTIANNITWILTRLDEIHKQVEMLMDYLDGRGEQDDDR